MSTLPTSFIILIGVAIVALLAVGIWSLAQKRRLSKRLEQHFGPEYVLTVAALGSRTKAESELKAREARVEGFTIIPLEPADAARFSQAWGALQARFVDNPKGVVVQADQLVRELMLKRGYPVGDSERRTADISVGHPAIVGSYRAAQAIMVRAERGVADTEELRTAVVHYRTLFDELLETRATNADVLPARRHAGHG